MAAWLDRPDGAVSSQCNVTMSRQAQIECGLHAHVLSGLAYLALPTSQTGLQTHVAGRSRGAWPRHHGSTCVEASSLFQGLQEPV